MGAIRNTGINISLPTRPPLYPSSSLNLYLVSESFQDFSFFTDFVLKPKNSPSKYSSYFVAFTSTYVFD